MHETNFSVSCAAQVTELISLSSKKFIELCRKLSDCETAQKAGGFLHQRQALATL